MKKFEYEIERFDFGSDDELLEHLRLRGEAGWELVYFQPMAVHNKCSFIFKREVL